MRVDGRQVAADGTRPGFHPSYVPIRDHTRTMTIAAGEASVITVHEEPAP